MAAVDYRKEGRIAIFTINRPEAMNALNTQVREEMNEALLDFRGDDDLWVGIITGAGDKAFSAGADIKESRSGPAAIARSKTMLGYIRPDQIWKPFIAAINGYCLGGGLEWTLQCDMRIAAEHARFGLPEITVGRIPGGGGTQRLTRFIPRAIAAEVLLMGQHITAQEAYRIGLVSRVVPLPQLMPTAKQMADTIGKLAPLAVRAVKEALIRGYDVTLEEGLRLEIDMANRVRGTEDYTEGATAFAEKRPPNYKAK